MCIVQTLCLTKNQVNGKGLFILITNFRSKLRRNKKIFLEKCAKKNLPFLNLCSKGRQLVWKTPSDRATARRHAEKAYRLAYTARNPRYNLDTLHCKEKGYTAVMPLYSITLYLYETAALCFYCDYTKFTSAICNSVKPPRLRPLCSANHGSS